MMIISFLIYCAIIYTYGFAMFDLENPNIAGIILWFLSPVSVPLIALVGLPFSGDNNK
jgi:hypothetical protein